MVATASSFFPAASPISVEFGAKSAKLGVRKLGGIKSKSVSGGGLKVKANTKGPSKINGTSVGLTSPAESVKNVGSVPSPAPRNFINQLPDWSMLLAAITTIFMAAEKLWMMLDWKLRRPDMLIGSFVIGKFVHDSVVFRQNFSIRSYETGADRTATIETLMNHFQETFVNHSKSAGLLADGFGCTPGMSKRNLIWVVTRTRVLVDRYPKWGDVVQVDTWMSASGN